MHHNSDGCFLHQARGQGLTGQAGNNRERQRNIVFARQYHQRLQRLKRRLDGVVIAQPEPRHAA